MDATVLPNWMERGTRCFHRSNCLVWRYTCTLSLGTYLLATMVPRNEFQLRAWSIARYDNRSNIERAKALTCSTICKRCVNTFPRSIETIEKISLGSFIQIIQICEFYSVLFADNYKQWDKSSEGKWLFYTRCYSILCLRVSFETKQNRIKEHHRRRKKPENFYSFDSIDFRQLKCRFSTKTI